VALVSHFIYFVFQFVHGNIKDYSSGKYENDETDHEIDLQMYVTHLVQALD
jgi:hypothetical protein